MGRQWGKRTKVENSPNTGHQIDWRKRSLNFAQTRTKCRGRSSDPGDYYSNRFEGRLLYFGKLPTFYEGQT